MHTEIIVTHPQMTPDALAAILWAGLNELHQHTPEHVPTLIRENITLTRAAVRKTIRTHLQHYGTPKPDTAPGPDYTPDARAWCLEQINHADYPWSD